MINFFSISLFILMLVSFDSNLILWNNETKLTWDNFKCKPVKGSSNSAISNCNISFNMKYENDSITVIINNYFDQNKSWVKHIAKNNYLLNHEQKHFDLFEVYTRILRKRIQNESYSFSNVEKKLNHLYTLTMKESFEIQTKYDKETKHSIDSINQKKWDKYIEDELLHYDKYNSSKLRLAIFK